MHYHLVVTDSTLNTPNTLVLFRETIKMTVESKDRSTRRQFGVILISFTLMAAYLHHVPIVESSSYQWREELLMWV